VFIDTTGANTVGTNTGYTADVATHSYICRNQHCSCCSIQFYQQNHNMTYSCFPSFCMYLLLAQIDNNNDNTYIHFGYVRHLANTYRILLLYIASYGLPPQSYLSTVTQLALSYRYSHRVHVLSSDRVTLIASISSLQFHRFNLTT
jgi:hypothetical protein